MPEFSHTDACMIQAEATLWNCLELLGSIEDAGSWGERINEIRKTLRGIAGEMRTYNEQFETEDDD